MDKVEEKFSVEQGNKLIAEFLNAPIDTKGAWESAWVKVPNKELSKWTLLSDLKYHSSWDWQIKVWSKIALAVKTMLPKHTDVQNEARWYFQKLNKYEQAVFQDKPEDGQKIVVELIEWYNANTKTKNI